MKMSNSLVAFGLSASTAVADTVEKGGFSAKVSVGELIEFQLTGLFVVFAVLGALTIMCYLMAWILKTVAPNQYYVKPGKPPAAPAKLVEKPVSVSPRAPSSSIHPGLADEELVVILAAAATEELGQAASVVLFRPIDIMDWTWSVQGRVGLHTSHKR